MNSMKELCCVIFNFKQMLRIHENLKINLILAMCGFLIWQAMKYFIKKEFFQEISFRFRVENLSIIVRDYRFPQ